MTRAPKGACKAPTSAPVYLRHVQMLGAPRTTLARKQQETHLGVSESLQLHEQTGLVHLVANLGKEARKWSSHRTYRSSHPANSSKHVG